MPILSRRTALLPALVGALLAHAAVAPATPPVMPLGVLVLSADGDPDRARYEALPAVLGQDHVFIAAPWDMGFAASPLCGGANDLSEACIRDRFYRTPWKPTHNRVIVLAEPAGQGLTRIRCIGRGEVPNAPSRQTVLVDMDKALSKDEAERKAAGEPVASCFYAAIGENPKPAGPLDDPSGTTRPPGCSPRDIFLAICKDGPNAIGAHSYKRD